MVFLKHDKSSIYKLLSVQTRADVGVCVWLCEEGNMWVGVQIQYKLLVYLHILCKWVQPKNLAHIS